MLPQEKRRAIYLRPSTPEGVRAWMGSDKVHQKRRTIQVCFDRSRACRESRAWSPLTACHQWCAATSGLSA